MSAPLCPFCTTMGGGPWGYDVLHQTHQAYVSAAVERIEASGRKPDSNGVSMMMLDMMLRSAVTATLIDAAKRASN